MTVVVSLISVLESGFPPLGGVAAPPNTLVNLRINVLFPQPESAAKPITTVFFPGATLHTTTARRPIPNPPLPTPPLLLLQCCPFTRSSRADKLSPCCCLAPQLPSPLCCPWNCDWRCSLQREEDEAGAATAAVDAMATESELPDRHKQTKGRAPMAKRRSSQRECATTTAAATTVKQASSASNIVQQRYSLISSLITPARFEVCYSCLGTASLPTIRIGFRLDRSFVASDEEFQVSSRLAAGLELQGAPLAQACGFGVEARGRLFGG